MTYQHVFQPATDPSAPTLLVLHGTGGNEHDLIPLARSISPRSAILSPRGDVNEKGQLRFFRRFAEGVFDLEDVRRRTDALAAFLADAAAHYGIEPRSVVALGFSNGANIAATLLQLHPGCLAGAILLRAMVVLPDQPADGRLRGTRILMSNGRFDPIIPLEQPPRLASIFRAAGADVQLHEQEASHGLVSADVQLAREWISQAAQTSGN